MHAHARGTATNSACCATRHGRTSRRGSYSFSGSRSWHSRRWCCFNWSRRRGLRGLHGKPTRHSPIRTRMHCASPRGAKLLALNCPATWEEYLAMLSKNYRELRSLSGNAPNTGWAALHNIERLEDLSWAMEVFIEMHQRHRHRWASRVASPRQRFTAYQRRAATVDAQGNVRFIGWKSTAGRLPWNARLRRRPASTRIKPQLSGSNGTSAGKIAEHGCHKPHNGTGVSGTGFSPRRRTL